MTIKKKYVYILILCAALAMISCSVLIVGMAQPVETKQYSSTVFAKDSNFAKPVNDFVYPYHDMGYSDLEEYWDDMQTKRTEAEGISAEAIEMYGDILTDEQKELLQEYELEMTHAVSPDEYESALTMFNAIVEECESVYIPPIYNDTCDASYGYSDPLNFKSVGVLSDDQYRYTYYSSNVLYHHRTPEWTAGSDGIYRDSNGRVIVASVDHPQGTIIQSDIFGECIVADTGHFASGQLDVYTNF